MRSESCFRLLLGLRFVGTSGLFAVYRNGSGGGQIWVMEWAACCSCLFESSLVQAQAEK